MSDSVENEESIQEEVKEEVEPIVVEDDDIIEEEEISPLTAEEISILEKIEPSMVGVAEAAGEWINSTDKNEKSNGIKIIKNVREAIELQGEASKEYIKMTENIVEMIVGTLFKPSRDENNIKIPNDKILDDSLKRGKELGYIGTSIFSKRFGSGMKKKLNSIIHYSKILERNGITITTMNYIIGNLNKFISSDKEQITKEDLSEFISNVDSFSEVDMMTIQNTVDLGRELSTFIGTETWNRFGKNLLKEAAVSKKDVSKYSFFTVYDLESIERNVEDHQDENISVVDAMKKSPLAILNGLTLSIDSEIVRIADKISSGQAEGEYFTKVIGPEISRFIKKLELYYVYPNDPNVTEDQMNLFKDSIVKYIDYTNSELGETYNLVSRRYQEWFTYYLEILNDSLSATIQHLRNGEKVE